jgi:hypothetical protein
LDELSGVAVRVTWEPPENPAVAIWQEVSQSMPAGELVTVPLPYGAFREFPEGPIPIFTTVRTVCPWGKHAPAGPVFVVASGSFVPR